MAAQYVTPISEAFPLWCQRLLRRSDWVLLDTETAEIAGRRAEAIAIAVVDPRGQTIYDRLFNPFAISQSGRGFEDPHELASFAARWAELDDVLRGKLIISYGAVYNSQVLLRTAALRQVEMRSYSWQCAMIAYAEHWAEPGRYVGSCRWQRLTEACRRQRIRRPDHGSQALADALATWQLIRASARKQPPVR